MVEESPAQAPQKKAKAQPIKGKLDLRTGGNQTFNEIINNCANALKERKFKLFEQEIAKAEAIEPKNPRVLHFRGLYAFEKRDTITAAKLLSETLTKAPNSPTVMHNFAAVLISLGQFEQAEKLLRNAIAFKPDYAEAFHTLSPIYTFEAEDPLIPLMKKGLETPGLNKVDTSFYAFALAKALDDAGDPDGAWPVLVQGNGSMARRYDPEKMEEAVKAIETEVTAEKLADLAQYGHPSQAPIFVVGMPRSGTTLLESIIADHPQVYGAGELTNIGGIGRTMAKNIKVAEAPIGYGKVIAQTTPRHVWAAGQGYLNSLKGEDKNWFDYAVDKMPDNSFNLGLISAILPQAQVIHIMRHPLDVMLSIYFQRFTTVRYGFHVDDIVGHWQNYQRAMAHWREVLPTKPIELRYENLVQDKDFAQNWLWEQLGLTKQIDHVDNNAAPDQQRTASRFQVKQPVYTSSREKFRKYEAHMGAFVEALGGMEAIEAEVEAQEARCALRTAAAG